MLRLLLAFAVLLMVCPLCFAQWNRIGLQPQEDSRSVVFVDDGSGNITALAGMKRFGVYSSLNSGPWQPTGLNEFALDTTVTGPTGDLIHQPAVVNALARVGVTVLAGTSSGKVFYSFDVGNNYASWMPSVFDHTVDGPVMNLATASNGDLFACVRGGTYPGIYRSQNAGANFQLLAGSIGTGLFMDLAFYGESSDKFWAVTDAGTLLSGGVYYWDGSSWEDLSGGLPTGQLAFSSIETSPSGGSPDYLWIGEMTGSGVFESADLGITWYPVGETCDRVQSLQVHNDYSYANRHLLVGTSYGLQEIISGFTNDLYPVGLAVNTIVGDPFNSQLYWLCTSAGMMRVIPGTNLPEPFQSNALALFDISAISSSPSLVSDQTIFALSNRLGVFSSMDGGATFQMFMPSLEKSQAGDPGFELAGFATSPSFSGTTGGCNSDSATLYLATRGRGVFKSASSGAEWENINEGLLNGGGTTSENLTICAFAVSPSASYPYRLYAARCVLPRIDRFNRGTGEWSSANLPPFPLNPHVSLIALPPLFSETLPFVYAGSDKGLYISTDGGETFVFDSELDALPGEKSVTGIAFHPLFDNETNKTVFAVRGGSVYAKHMSASWQQIGAGLPSNEYHVNKIAISPNYQIDQTLAITFTNPADHANDGIWLSNNGGDMWINVSNNLGDRYPNDIRFVNTTPMRLFAGLRKERLWYSDGPAFNNWSAAADWKTSPVCVNTVAISSVNTSNCGLPSAPTDVFLGTCKGVFWSNDGGQNFRPINEGLLASDNGCYPIAVNALHISGDSFPVLLAGTEGRGIHYRHPSLVVLPNGQTVWDWSGGTWVQADGPPSSSTVHRFSRETNFGLSSVYIRAATSDGAWSSSGTQGTIGHFWVTLGLSGETVTSLCHGVEKASAGLKESIPDPKAPESGTIWGTVWGTGVKKGTGAGSKSEGLPHLADITWSDRNGVGSGSLPEAYNWSVIQLDDGAVLSGGDTNGVYRSDDEGETFWFQSNGGLENTTKTVRDFLETSSLTNDDIFCAIEGSGYPDTNGGIFISADGGLHWACISAGFDPDQQQLSDIIETEGTPPVYYAGTFSEGSYAKTITPLEPPAITSIDVSGGPEEGPSTGGTTVYIYGTNFQCECPDNYDCSNFGISQAVASFGGVDAATVSCSSTELQVTTPPHIPGTVSVTVRNPDTRSAARPAAFKYTGESSDTIYLSLNGSGQIVVSWEDGSPSTIYKSRDKSFSSYVAENLSSSPFTFDETGDTSGINGYTYFFKVE